MRKHWKAFWFIFIITGSLWTCACGREKPDTDAYLVYYVNHDMTGVISQEYRTETKDSAGVLEELIARLQKVPEKLEYHAPLAESFHLLDYHKAEGQLILNFDETYYSQELITEILMRAAIVRTLVQAEDVQYVSFAVNGEPLTDASGNVVGVMNGDTFIDNAGKEINTYEKAKLKLYFANDQGSQLVGVTRTKVYSSNIAMERLIVDEILAGPKEEDLQTGGNKILQPSVSPDTRVNSVTIRDGICYVNLDNGFLNAASNVSPEVVIYSITNSLAELPNVNKVQISVNGETNVNYREKINLSTFFERNLDLVSK